MKKIKRKNKDNSIIKALTDAQKLIFAPLAFQAVAALLDFGIMDLIDKTPASENEIIEKLNLDEYTVKTLLQIGILNNLIQKSGEVYSLTRTGGVFLYDEMTKVNFNYVRDLCYLGAGELVKSFKTGKPEGLHKYIGNYPTIYPAITALPEKLKQHWYEFDHFYSDNCFDEVYEIITKKYNKIYDIGGNTGRFEKVCLGHNKNIDITMFDLKENIETIEKDAGLQKCKFQAINVLDENPNYPEMNNCAVFMSQFLDCFSKKDIRKILADLKNTIDENSAIYILEPYTDRQKFEAAEYSLCHASLYFTCMANGVSKFYTFEEMKNIIESAGLYITNCINDIGSFNYTLLECRKNAVVSN